MRRRDGSRDHAFCAIYEQHGPAIHAYLARRVAAEHVDDLAAETFTVAWRKLPSDVDEPLPWLYAVARREVLAHRRKLAGGSRLVARLAAFAPRTAEDAALAHAEMGLEAPLAAAFARLTDTEKEALLLVAWEELDYAQAGRVVGCTAATFSARVSRARAKVRDALTATPLAEERPR
jgi:RNA polymerase sigma-70 factor (ECF subfamily)